LLYVATVHFETDRWIDLQLGRLARHTTVPYEVFASLSGKCEEHAERFSSALQPQSREHGEQLNLLAERIVNVARDDDLLIFLDGDAFPIRNYVEQISGLLADRPLVAARRLENKDHYPHPLFCATTVAFWRNLGGDWTRDRERRLDVGGKVQERLSELNLEWTPLDRTNRRNLHPVLFGIYGDLIYHHGGGFRPPKTRHDSREATRNSAYLPFEARQEMVRKRVEQTAELSDRVYREIVQNDSFAEDLFGYPNAPVSR
jgi:hypothetical protein